MDNREKVSLNICEMFQIVDLQTFFFSDILKITKTLKYEPLSVEDIEEIIAFRAREDELWKKYVVHVKPGASAHSLFYNFETE